ncbi:hypothetical protein V6767_09525 [Martelella sp. FLE1502]
MPIARLAIEKPLYTWLLILFCLFGGAAGYLGVGKLEDPVVFTFFWPESGQWENVEFTVRVGEQVDRQMETEF